MRSEKTIREKLERLKARQDHWAKKYPNVHPHTYYGTEIRMLEWVLNDKKKGNNA